MPTAEDLVPLLTDPREDLGAEFKDWLNLQDNEHKAVVAKAAIAIANHGGGFIILGFDERDERLVSHEKPEEIPDISQDAINAAVRRFSSTEFHCEVYFVRHPLTEIVHPIVRIPGGMTEPVLSRRDCGNVIAQNKCYVRKPGPRSEEPQTQEEWRNLLNRCLRAGRDGMLESIRAIVSGRVEEENIPQDVSDLLEEFVEEARQRWIGITQALAPDASARFPHGSYEMAFSLLGAEPANGLAQLQGRLRQARQISYTGWTPFLELNRPELAPYPEQDCVEAWLGQPNADRIFDDAAHCDFWRVAPDGKLYTRRGYSEDGMDNRAPGTVFDVTLPIWRISEGILFARRLAEAFEGVDGMLIKCSFDGLEGRALISHDGRIGVFGDDVSRTARVALERQVTLAQIDDNLVEIVHQLLTPLYEKFNFFELTQRLVEDEVDRMIRR
ncbi:RNA-binding domain-containing protein [Thalassospira tepidiphila]|uniref:RNA-binding domain-containing protein n=1 Tax=Thalassospira tepidiphila TaxID=393657 RepID=UPI003AA90D72